VSMREMREGRILEPDPTSATPAEGAPTGSSPLAGRVQQGRIRTGSALNFILNL
jgi:hypothetical protein